MRGCFVRCSYKRREIFAVVICVVLYLIGVNCRLGLVILHTSLHVDLLLKYKNGFLYLIIGLSSSDTRTNYNDLPSRSRHLNRLFKLPNVLVCPVQIFLSSLYELLVLLSNENVTQTILLKCNLIFCKQLCE